MHIFVYVFTSRGFYLEEWGQNSTSSEEYSVSGECRLQKCHSTYRCVILSKLVKVLDKIFTCDRLKDKNFVFEQICTPSDAEVIPVSMFHVAMWSDWKYYCSPLAGMLVHRKVTPPPSPPHFVRLPTIRRYLFILLCRERHGESNVFCPRK